MDDAPLIDVLVCVDELLIEINNLGDSGDGANFPSSIWNEFNSLQSHDERRHFVKVRIDEMKLQKGHPFRIYRRSRRDFFASIQNLSTMMREFLQPYKLWPLSKQWQKLRNMGAHIHDGKKRNAEYDDVAAFELEYESTMRKPVSWIQDVYSALKEIQKQNTTLQLPAYCNSTETLLRAAVQFRQFKESYHEFENDAIFNMLSAMEWKKYVKVKDLHKPENTAFDSLLSYLHPEAVHNGVQIVGDGGLGKSALMFHFVRNNLEIETPNSEVPRFDRFLIFSAKADTQGQPATEPKKGGIGFRVEPNTRKHGPSNYVPNLSFDEFIRLVNSLEPDYNRDYDEHAYSTERASEILTRQRCLVVLDNFEDCEESDVRRYEEFLESLRRACNSKFLITGRRKDVLRNIPQVELGHLDETEAINLMWSRYEFCARRYSSTWKSVPKHASQIAELTSISQLDSSSQLIKPEVKAKLSHSFSHPLVIFHLVNLLGDQDVWESLKGESLDFTNYVAAILNKPKFGFDEYIREFEAWVTRKSIGQLSDDAKIILDIIHEHGSATEDDMASRFIEQQPDAGRFRKAFDRLSTTNILITYESNTGESFIDLSEASRRILGGQNPTDAQAGSEQPGEELVEPDFDENPLHGMISTLLQHLLKHSEITSMRAFFASIDDLADGDLEAAMNNESFSPHAVNDVLIFVQKLQELDVMDPWRTKSNALRKHLLTWLNDIFLKRDEAIKPKPDYLQRLDFLTRFIHVSELSTARKALKVLDKEMSTNPTDGRLTLTRSSLVRDTVLRLIGDLGAPQSQRVSALRTLLRLESTAWNLSDIHGFWAIIRSDIQASLAETDQMATESGEPPLARWPEGTGDFLKQMAVQDQRWSNSTFQLLHRFDALRESGSDWWATPPHTWKRYTIPPNYPPANLVMQPSVWPEGSGLSFDHWDSIEGVAHFQSVPGEYYTTLPDVSETEQALLMKTESDSPESVDGRADKTLHRQAVDILLGLLEQNENGFSVDSVQQKISADNNNHSVRDLVHSATNGVYNSWFEWLKVEVLADPNISDVMQHCADRTIRNGGLGWIGPKSAVAEAISAGSVVIATISADVWFHSGQSTNGLGWPSSDITALVLSELGDNEWFNGLVSSEWPFDVQRRAVIGAKHNDGFSHQSSHIGRLCWVLAKQYQLQDQSGQWSLPDYDEIERLLTKQVWHQLTKANVVGQQKDVYADHFRSWWRDVRVQLTSSDSVVIGGAVVDSEDEDQLVSIPAAQVPWQSRPLNLNVFNAWAENLAALSPSQRTIPGEVERSWEAAARSLYKGQFKRKLSKNLSEWANIKEALSSHFSVPPDATRPPMSMDEILRDALLLSGLSSTVIDDLLVGDEDEPFSEDE